MNLYRILALLLVVQCAPAFAQNSLGDGTGLDASTSPYGKTNQQEYLPAGVRNSDIRSSSVLQGKNFNQGIGRNSGDAAGMQLLADAANEGGTQYLDALYNSPWYWNNWSSQSAQFLSQGELSYFNPNFIDNWATAPKQMSIGRNILSYSHEWNEKDAQRFGGKGEVQNSDKWLQRHEDQHKLGQVLGSGEPPESLDTTPIPVGLYQGNGSVGYLAASPMGGVSAEKTDQPTSALGFSAWDEARVAEDSAMGIGSDRLVQVWRSEENRLDQPPVNNQIDVSDQYNQVLESVAQRAQDEIDSVETGDAKSMEWLDNQYFQLQNDLAGIPFEGDESDDSTSIESTVNTEDLQDDSIEIIAAALRHGEQLTSLSGDAGQYRTRFDELVQLGELALERGKYFDAQRRFNQALQFIPGHPLATAGLGHAKIGAGLYLSAGYILQSLLSFQPEMIDVEYDPILLPPRLELVRAAVTIGNRLDIERDAGTYAFLLAYIGHQLHDEEMITNGLNTLAIYTSDNDPLVPLLKSIWLKQKPAPILLPAEPELQEE
jgi:tetratricopeptide (TPR) repeat protein